MTSKTVKTLSDQGKIVFYDERTKKGRIQSFDKGGNSYDFILAEWRNENERPKFGAIVNFEITENEKSREAVCVRPR